MGNKIQFLFLSALFMMFSLACTTPRKVKIESEPPGAHAYFDGQYLGTTPLEVNAPYRPNLGTSTFVYRAVTAVKVEPAQGMSNACMRYYLVSGQSEFPEKMMFNLHVCPK